MRHISHISVSLISHDTKAYMSLNTKSENSLTHDKVNLVEAKSGDRGRLFEINGVEIVHVLLNV